jgi:hypothetical protein
MSLALKAKGQPVATLSLVPPLVNTGDPDIALIHRKVKQAIAKSEHPPAKGSHKSGKNAGVTGGSIGSLKDGYAANDSNDLRSAC